MIEKKSILEELYTDGGGFDVRKVVGVLKPILNIQRGGSSVFFTKEGHAMKNENKIIAYYLVKKLLKNEGVIDEVGTSGKEVREVTELPKGTVDNAIFKLKKDGLLAGKGKSYEIPTRFVDLVIERLEKDILK